MSLHESEVEVRRAVRVLTHYLADGAEIGARLYAAYVAHTTGEPQPAAEGFTAPDPTGMWARARAIDAARRRDVSLALAEHTEQAIRVVGGWVPDRGGAT